VARTDQSLRNISNALGIIQNSPDDWTAEASKMGQYYHNALLNICAVSSSDGSGGVFRPRNPLILTPFPIEVRFPHTEEAGPDSGRTVAGLLRPLLAKDPAYETDSYMTNRPPLWQRAWVLQERMLPTRLLMFSDSQMSWLCGCDEASEMLPEGQPRRKEGSEENKKLRAAILGILEIPSPLSNPVDPTTDNDWQRQDMQRLYNAWYDLVGTYTKCGLTFSSDIFPAIGGIASRLGHTLGDEYVAGLWKGDLHRGLLWSAVSSTQRLDGLREYRAPSWSWAALPATCSFVVRGTILHDIDMRPFEIQEARAETDGRDPYGQVRSAWLSIRGHLKKADVVSTAAVDREDKLKRVVEKRLRYVDNLFDLDAGVSLGSYIADNKELDGLTDVWCTPVISCRSFFDKSGKSRDWYGLVLVPDPGGRVDGSRQCFRRVGHFTIWAFDWFSGCESAEFSII
jgi:hypothetical protein